MVLEINSDSTDGVGFEIVPSSDEDPYDNSSRPDNFQYYVDPKALPKFMPFFGYNQNFKDETRAKLLIATKELGRPLSQDEVNALAYWLAKRRATASWGLPIGVACGAWRAYQTMGTYRFPFWQPDTKILKMDVFGPLRGHSAKWCWHTLRFLSYSLMGKVLVGMIFSSYAVSTTSVGASADPRLNEFLKVIRHKIENQRLPQSSNGSYKKQNKAIDDSTDGESFTRDMAYEESQAGPESTSSSADNTLTRSWKTRKPVSSIPQATEEDPFATFDSAFPREKQDGTTTSIDASSGKPYISAWERLRAGETIPQPGNSVKSTRRPYPRQAIEKEDSFLNGSFSFPRDEENRTLAKEQSQREFDAQVERERRGNL